MKNDQVKEPVEGRNEKRSKENRDSQTEMKQRCMENKNASPLSVSLCICLTQQSGQ